MAKESNAPTVNLPDVGRIQGLHYQPSPLNDPAADKVEVQYTDRAQGRWHTVTMPLLDALYLLNMLEELSRARGFDSLRRGEGFDPHPEDPASA